MSEIQEILSRFESLELHDIQDVKLMDRIDNKFLFKINLLPEVLKSLINDYSILEINNKRIFRYDSLYFDTDNFSFYTDHHNKKDHRLKIRKRSYTDTDTHFLEVKEKRKGRTVKSRIEINEFNRNLTKKELEFVSDFIDSPENLNPKTENSYSRITLVAKNKKERLTLDINLAFYNAEKNKKLEQTVIAELKQPRIDYSSDFFKLMKEKKIRPFRVSKYCIGTLLVFGNENIKYNRFKEKLLKLRKIENGDCKSR